MSDVKMVDCGGAVAANTKHASPVVFGPPTPPPPSISRPTKSTGETKYPPPPSRKSTTTAAPNALMNARETASASPTTNVGAAATPVHMDAPRYQSTPFTTVPAFWYDCWDVSDWPLPMCLSIDAKDEWQKRRQSNWGLAIDFLHQNLWNTPWSEIPVTVLLKLHMLLVDGTRRTHDKLVVKPGQWRDEMSMVYFEPLEPLMKDPQRLALIWTTADLKRWMQLQLHLDQFRAKHKDCVRPFETMCLQRKLTPKEWTTLRKIAFVPPLPEDVPDMLVEFWREMQRLLAAPKPNILGLVSYVHQQLTSMHPFARSGNGRVARLLIGFILLRHGYLPFPCSPRRLYHASVVIGDLRPIKLQEFFAHQLRVVHSVLVHPITRTFVDYRALNRTLDARLEQMVAELPAAVSSSSAAGTSTSSVVPSSSPPLTTFDSRTTASSSTSAAASTASGAPLVTAPVTHLMADAATTAIAAATTPAVVVPATVALSTQPIFRIRHAMSRTSASNPQ